MNAQEDSFFSFFLATSTANFLAFSVFAPVERVKIVLQTHRLSQVSSAEILRNPAQAFAQIRKTQGITAFWHGNAVFLGKELGNLLIRYAISWSLLRATLNPYEDSGFSRKLKKYSAFFCGSLFSLTFTYPLEIVRIRLMKDMSLKGEPRVFQGFGDCVRKIFIKEGPRSFFKGYAYSVGWLVPSLTVSFGIFEFLKGFVDFRGSFQRNQENPEETKGNQEKGQGNQEKSQRNAWILGIFAISLGQTLLYPLDTVRKRLQTNGGIDHIRLYNGARDCFKTMWKMEGIRAFYAGFLLNLLRIGPQTLLQLLVFSETMGFLSEIRDEHQRFLS